MAPVGDLLGTLVAVAFGLYLLHLLYGLVHRAFRAVGFTPQQATLIILGTFLGGLVNLPLAEVNGWVVAINVGGAVIPLVIAWQLLRTRHRMVDEALVGVTLTTIATYLVTDATPQGIVSPFPLYLLPALVAAAVSAVAFWQDRDDAAPLAYVSGTLGAIIGADVMRLSQFLAQAPPEGEGLAMASIGGAAVFDMVFLTGVLAVGLDLLFFRQRRQGHTGQPEAYGEGVVFTPTTPPDVFAAYTPSEDPLIRGRHRKETKPPSEESAVTRAQREWESFLGHPGNR